MITKTSKEVEEKLNKELKLYNSFKETALRTINQEDKKELEHAIKLQETRISLLNWLTT